MLTPLLLSICSLFACSVHAQTTSPQFIVSQSPQQVDSVGEPVGWTHDSQFIGLNNYQLNFDSSTFWDPENVANKIMDRVHARLYIASPASLSEEENPVGFYGFAGGVYRSGDFDEWQYFLGNHTSLRHFDDPIQEDNAFFVWPNSNYFTTTNSEYKYFALVHPWMNMSRARMKTWTEDFVAQVIARHVTSLSTSEPIPLPTRFMYDSEEILSGCCEVGWLYNLRNIMLCDDRWNTEQVPGYPFGTTMEDLYAQASIDYGWILDLGNSSFSQPTYPAGFSLTDNAWEPKNRPLLHWYGSVVKRIHVAIMEECAFAPIREAYADYATANPTLEVPVPILSNYGNYNTDGQPDTTGWMQDRPIRVGVASDPDGVPQYAHKREDHNTPYLPDSAITNQFRRLSLDTGSQGARMGHAMVEFPGSSITPVAQERWAMHSTTTSSDRDAVVLYDWHVAEPETLSPFTFTQKNWYVPASFNPSTGTCTHGLEGSWQANMRLHRHRVGSVLNSNQTVLIDGAVERAPYLFPYIQYPSFVGDYGHEFLEDDIVVLLQMLRAKDVKEIATFNFHSPSHSKAHDEWVSMNTAYDRAYAFDLVEYEWIVGTGATHTLTHPQDLHTTLRKEISSPPFFEETRTSGHSENTFTNQATELKVHFEPRYEMCDQTLSITLEGAVGYDDEVTRGDLSNIFGEVYILDHSVPGGGWSLVTFPDYDSRYAICTPESLGLKTFRRTVDLFDNDMSRFYSPLDGSVTLLMRHSVGEHWIGIQDPFRSYYDLVQLAPHWTCGESEERMMMQTGSIGEPVRADFDFNGEVDVDDLVSFSEQWGDDRIKADYNVDGVVDQMDQTLFLYDYADQVE